MIILTACSIFIFILALIIKTFWVGCLLGIVVGVLLVIAQTQYEKLEEKVDELEERNDALMNISNNLLKALKFHDQTLDMLTHQVETLDKKEFKGEEE